MEVKESQMQGTAFTSRAERENPRKELIWKHCPPFQSEIQASLKRVCLCPLDGEVC